MLHNKVRKNAFILFICGTYAPNLTRHCKIIIQFLSTSFLRSLGGSAAIFSARLLCRKMGRSAVVGGRLSTSMLGSRLSGWPWNIYCCISVLIPVWAWTSSKKTETLNQNKKTSCFYTSCLLLPKCLFFLFPEVDVYARFAMVLWYLVLKNDWN